jgi:hypothetical protein
MKAKINLIIILLKGCLIGMCYENAARVAGDLWYIPFTVATVILMSAITLITIKDESKTE